MDENNQDVNKTCANGDGRPICPQSKIICRECLDDIGQNFKKILNKIANGYCPEEEGRMARKRSQIVHEVKCIHPYFQDICNGVKSFDLRYDDRGYMPGDGIMFKEYDPVKKKYSGNTVYLKICYILRDFSGLENGFCILGLE